MQHFGIEHALHFVSEGELDGTRSKKEEVIQYVLQQNTKTALDSVVMVGDRKHDIIGAAQTGIDSIGVLYSYGSLAELTDAGAASTVATVGELHKALLAPSVSD